MANDPKPVENPQTYGGSGRDRENADFPTSPDVNPDGTLGDSDIQPIQETYRQAEPGPGRRLWDWLLSNEYITTYALVAVILAIVHFGLGIDVIALLKNYLAPVVS